ncbi:hypothetical protein BASA81_003982 [Batrachochytrium salamandrivorans]|nr:hypothetical protein BASA81_003982 [Batrachochytrium salamandrivorans]
MPRINSPPEHAPPSFPSGLGGRLSTATMVKKKSTLPRTQIKKTLNIMRLDHSGAYELLSVTQEEVLDICRKCVSERLTHLPFGEVMLRDLRSVDPTAFGTEPKIQVRSLCALVSLDPIHAFLLPDQLILILGEGADAFLHNVKTRLGDLLDEEEQHKQRKIFRMDRQSSTADGDSATTSSRMGKRRHSDPTGTGSGGGGGGIDERRKRYYPPPASIASSHDGERPFQLIALDALFSSLCQSIEGETTLVELLVKDATNSKKIEHPNKDTYRGLRKAETELDIFKTRLIAVRKAVNDFFMDDKELAAMSFDSVIAHYAEDADQEEAAFTPFLEDQSEAENLSENLLFFLDEKIGKVKQAESFIDIANTNLVLHLSDTNNTLLKVTIMIQSITAGGTICAVIAGIFGMNLYSGLMVDGDEDTTSFWIVFSVLLSFFAFFMIGFYYYSYKKGLLDLGMSPT